MYGRYIYLPIHVNIPFSWILYGIEKHVANVLLLKGAIAMIEAAQIYICLLVWRQKHKKWQRGEPWVVGESNRSKIEIDH